MTITSDHRSTTSLLAGDHSVDDITHAELVRMVLRMHEQQERTQQQLSQLTMQVSSIVREAEQHRTDLDQLTSWQTWGVRLILGFVALAVLGFIWGEAVGGTP